MNDNCWLPDMEHLENYNNDWNKYESELYRIFKNDFLDSYPYYQTKRVAVRHYPIEYGKEEAFYHTTCKDYESKGERMPDFRRCERMRWVRAFIENYCDGSECEDCDGVKIWREPYKSKTRVHILLEEEKYMVVLEHRPHVGDRAEYYLLITAVYLDYENSLKKELAKFRQYQYA